MNEIYLATKNLNKTKEISSILPEGFFLKSISDLSEKQQSQYNPIEDGATFRDNALIKARALQKLTDTCVIAEDTGLCVDALWGRPGIYSARYAPTDEEKITRLVDELKNKKRRTAQFVTAMVYLDQKSNPVFFIARAKGLILEQARGSGGFGYDPIFYFPPLKKTFGELKPEEKSQVSHRAQATRLLLQYLENLSKEISSIKSFSENLS